MDVPIYNIHIAQVSVTVLNKYWPNQKTDRPTHGDLTRNGEQVHMKLPDACKKALLRKVINSCSLILVILS